MTDKFVDKDLSILEISVKLPQNTYELDLAKDSQIDVNNLNQGFIEQPTIFAWYATLAAIAKSKVIRLKREVEKQDDYIRKTLIGTLDGKVRKNLEIEGEKITETKVTNAIYADAEYIANIQKLNELKDELTDAEEQSAILDVAKDTMIQRKDMLISLGAQVRSEYDGVSDMSIKGDEVDADKVRSILKSNSSSKRKPIVTR
jgi:hypothetical protein